MIDSSDDIPKKKADADSGVSLADIVPEHDSSPAWLAIPKGAWFKIAAVLAVLCVVNYRQFSILLDGWANPDWSHGYIIPLFSLYLLYVRRHEILSSRREVFGLGIIPVLIFCAASIVAYSVQNPLLCQLSAICLLLSTVLFLCGWRLAILLALPILFLAFALPIPSIIYSRLALPLQHLAAQCAGSLLAMFGGQIDVSSSMMVITSVSGQVHSVEVAEACSGMKMLMAFLALGVAMAYLADRPVWQRVTMVILAVPVAVACNVLRVTITAAMFMVDKKELGEGFMHEFTGMLMLIPAAILFWLIGRLLRAMVKVEESPEVSPAGAEAVQADISPAAPAADKPSAGRFSRLAFPIVILLMVTSGVLGNMSKWIPKEPVAWPAAIKVSDDFRLISFPDRIGDYVLVTDDFNGDGKSDGEIAFKPQDVQLLGMGDKIDQERLPQRSCNWYMSRVYRDVRVKDDSPFKYWRLELFYYTGRRDLVPHVAERCLAAAGAQIIESSDFSVSLDGGIPDSWVSPTPLRRIIFESFTGGNGWNSRYVQYYTFSMNGICLTDWKQVRLGLASPFVRHCFFAKMQFAPLGRIDMVKDFDSPAAEFCAKVIPVVLEYLPSHNDVIKLDAGK